MPASPVKVRSDVSTRYQALPGNALPEALPPIFPIASEEIGDRHLQ